MQNSLSRFLSQPLPLFASVSQRFSSERIEDVCAETRQKLLAAGLQAKIFKGARIAITAGSRGIGGFLELINGIVDAVNAAGTVEAPHPLEFNRDGNLF